MTNKDIQQAKEWAKESVYFDDSSGFASAVRVIQSLPDHIIDADKVREILAEQYMKIEGSDTKWINAATIEALLTPPLPTLADMAPEERQACLRAQAQTWHEVGIIVWVDADTEIAQLITRANGVLERKFKDVTPLPGLPKLEWPAQEPQPDHRTFYGPITISPPTRGEETEVRKQFDEPDLTPLCPEDVPAGEAWLIRYEGKEYISVKAGSIYDSKPWVIHLKSQGDYWWVRENDITLVSRLVPEVAP